jgi:orotate phosphoribosyltransferase
LEVSVDVHVLSEIFGILKKEGVIKDNYANFDLLFDKPSVLQTIADLIIKRKLNGKQTEFDVIVAADKIKGPFGALPLAILLAVKMQKHLLIWKEQLIGAHELFGNTEPFMEEKGRRYRKRALILHDVNWRGSTVAKIAKDLEEKGFELFKILSVLEREVEKFQVFKDIEKRGITDYIDKL